MLSSAIISDLSVDLNHWSKVVIIFHDKGIYATREMKRNIFTCPLSILHVISFTLIHSEQRRNDFAALSYNRLVKIKMKRPRHLENYKVILCSENFLEQ